MLHRHPFLSLITGAYLVFVGWLTLTPQPIDADRVALIERVLDAAHRRGYFEAIDYNRLEFLANIALFVPIGMFALILLGTNRWLMACLLCLAMTVAIEAIQREIPGRVSDKRDLIANELGAIIGVILATIITLPATIRRARRRRERSVAGIADS